MGYQFRRGLVMRVGPLALTVATVMTGCAQTAAPHTPSSAPGEPAATDVQDEWGVITIPAGRAVKIGFGAALAGPYAKFGKDIENTVRMAADDKGQVHGLQIQIIAEDDQCEAAPAAAAARKFTADEHMVGVIAHMCSGSTVAAIDIYNEKKLAMISASSTAVEVTRKGLPAVFRTAWNDVIQGKVAADFARENLKARKVAILHDKSAFGQGLAEEFQRHVTSGGAEIVAVEGVNRGERDYSPVLAKIRPATPDVVYFGGMAPEAALLVRQLKGSERSTVFLTGSAAYDAKEFIEAAGGAAEGAYVTYAKLPKGAQYALWEEDFRKRFSSDVGTFSPQGYDAARILLDAVDKAARKQADGSLKIGRKMLADTIRATQWEGVTGPIRFDASGDRSGSIVVVNTVRGKEFVEVK